MVFRFLCLHGMGVNGRIFETQTAPFRDLLPLDYEFVFVDAPTPCDAAPGVAEIYPGPYLCWYRSPTTANVIKAHELITSIMHEQGPFDAVMGFSQGAAIAASMLLHHQLNDQLAAPLFKTAIFFCSPLPFSHGLQHGIDARKYFGITNIKQIENNQRSSKLPEHLKTDPRYLRNEEQWDMDDMKQSQVKQQLDNGIKAERQIFYQMFHPTVDDVRISIPTVHIFGRRDQWYLHSKDVMGFASTGQATKLEHDFGHEIPRELSEEICDAIETAVSMA